jgi:NADH dehydrogenase FAD-containing subunit
MKEIQDGVRVRNAVFRRFEQAALPMSDDDRKKLLSFVVVGGGPTGVEVAAELQDLIDEDLAGSRKGHGNTLYKNALRSGACVTLVQSGDGLLKGYDPNCSAMALSEMSAAGINVLLRHRVKEVIEMQSSSLRAIFCRSLTSFPILHARACVYI